ncbi:hypothetical protein LEN26_015883 [Aphanomyces euteiches]|nr:hypothetical protein LEN26_015883 [Aphanomyces euteiches]KAH9125719.1 hypothetical protein AeMF1_003704 [Aphanomyces euteiches]KAH9187420.1 hypothetical protein AeNC1_010601 [Aphanomyces euteiches]
MGSRKHYPLPSSFFSCPKLSPSEEAQFVSLAKESLQQFIEMGLEPMEYSWTSQGEQNGVRLYEGPPDPRHKHVVPYRGVTTIHGTIHEVAMLRAFETRELCLRHVHRNAKASNLLDIMPLYSFVERTSESPLQQIYVNWCAITSPLPIVKDRDFLFLESQDEFTLEDGRNGWAYCQHSIALASCPPQTLSGLSLVRGSIYHSGCIFIESADTPGVLEVLSHYTVDIKGNLPMWLRRHSMHRFITETGLLNQHIHEMRLGSMPLKTLVECEPVGRSKYCSLCTRSFGLWSAKNCQRCGQVVCQKCSQRWRVGVGSSVQICIDCSNQVRDHSEWQMAATSLINRRSHAKGRSSPPSLRHGTRSYLTPRMSCATQTMDMRRYIDEEARVREARKERARQAMYSQLTPGMDRFIALDTIRTMDDDPLASELTERSSSSTTNEKSKFDLGYLDEHLQSQGNGIHPSVEEVEVKTIVLSEVGPIRAFNEAMASELRSSLSSLNTDVSEQQYVKMEVMYPHAEPSASFTRLLHLLAQQQEHEM